MITVAVVEKAHRRFWVQGSSVADWAQGDISVTGEHSPYNNMRKMGKKLAKLPFIEIFH